MALLITKLSFICLFFLIFVPSFARYNNKPIRCENDHNEAHESLNYECSRNNNASENQCNTFAVLHTNSYYSSLYNLTHYLGLNRYTIAEENGFSPDTEFISSNQPLLIPVNCKCDEKKRVFQAELMKTTSAGESFSEIADSLEGLTTCKAIQEKNTGVSQSNIIENLKISIPVRCACPTSSDISSGFRLLVSYAVGSGDSVSSLAALFNVTTEAIMSANKRSNKGNSNLLMIKDHSLSVLIPLKGKPLLGSLAKPSEPSLGLPSENRVKADEKMKKKRKKKRMKLGVSVGVVCFVFVSSVIVFGVVFLRQRRKKQEQNCVPSSKMVDTELQQLSLSIRTASEKKVSFEGSQSTLDGQGDSLNTPRNNNNTTRIMLESYTVEELQRATEDFDSHNLIEGKVYLGRIKGKDVAIKSTTLDYISKVDLGLFQDAIHNHPSIMRVLGTCIVEDKGSPTYLVFEYAKNGSLKDWIHGGLAMKSQFIASCSCFLTWRQRIKVCLDVALALQYMHHIMHPVYVHRNIKSKNIFLDEEFNAKVGNFGMSKCVEQTQDDTGEFSPRNPASWDKGYLAPEYIKHGAISPSIDVYAYGVVLLEILSGETPVMMSPREGEICMIAEKIKSILNTENVDELRSWMDKDLGEHYSFDGAIALATLARGCIDEDPSLRPSAGEIVEKLSRLISEESHEGEQATLMNESSSKPLVQAVTISSSNSDV